MTTTITTRERLIRAAQEELIRSRGHLEMQAVAKRAKVSVGLAYHHFGSKAGLIAAVVEAFYGRLDGEVFNDACRPSEGWADRERRRIASYIAFHYDHPFAPLVIGALSRAPEVLDVERAFTKRQLVGGARMLEAAQRDGFVPDHIDPHLTIALMIGGIRQALVGALTSEQRPDPETLTDEIWAFIAGALRLTAGSGIKKSRDNVAWHSTTASQAPKEIVLSDPRDFHAPQSSYTKQDLLKSSEGGYFGPGNAQLPAPPMLMMDRITEISLDGGEFGKGHVIAELDITPGLWFFDCHFRGDPVMPGCLGLDALWQIIGYWLGWSGSPGKGRAVGVGEVKFRGDIKPDIKRVRYEVSIRQVRRGKLAVGIADGSVFADDACVYLAKDMRVGMIAPAI